MQADNSFQPAYCQITFRVDILIAKKGVLNRRLKIISVMQLVCNSAYARGQSLVYYSLLFSRIFFAFPALRRELLANVFHEIS